MTSDSVGEEAAIGAPTSLPIEKQTQHSFLDGFNPRRRRTWLLISFLFLFACIGTAVVILTIGDDAHEQSESDRPVNYNRYVEIRGALSQYSDTLDFLHPQSPQNQALSWLAYQDQTDVSSTTLVQRYALLVLSFTCGGDNWVGLSEPWTKLVDQHECEFDGVTCDADSRLVTTLKLQSFRLTGRLPKELALLPSLQVLDLSKNKLEGPIPAVLFEQLVNLRELDLESNELSSTLSSHIGRLVNLEKLALNGNFLTGALPSSMSNMLQLRKYS